MVRILLARHGESDWNREDRWQGHADRPLSQAGREQALALARTLAGVRLDAIHASDLLRARDTAEAVAVGRGLAVQTHRGLREVDVGSWTGLTWDEVSERCPDGRTRWASGETGWDGGEDYEAMAERVVATLRALAEPADELLAAGAETVPAAAQTAPASAESTMLVVAHGGPLRAVLATATGVDVVCYRRAFPTPGNAELSAVAFRHGRFAPLPLAAVLSAADRPV